MPTWAFDTEVLPNRTLFCAKNIETGEWFDLWRHESNSPERLIEFVMQPDTTLIGFNNKSFDNAVVSAWCQGRTELEIKRIADNIIGNDMRPWRVLEKYGLNKFIRDDIDLIEVAPSFVGLKAYGARMHMPKLQEMPIAHDEMITPYQEPILLEYCHNDVETTEELVKQLEGDLTLRVEMSRMYRVDMRSKSGGQVAEQVYVTTLGLRRNQKIAIPETVRFKPPEFLKFESSKLQELLKRTQEHAFYVHQNSGHVQLPDFLKDETVKSSTGEYQLGIGGIHSTHDLKVCHVAGNDHIYDIDAASFYPSIIIECGFVPPHLGGRFINEFRKIYSKRLSAKRDGNTVISEALKLALNNTFGNFANLYSVVFAPEIMLAITLTGQFTLLMLIEWLEKAGVSILSANTDGIAIRFTKEQKEVVECVVKEFSALTRFVFECTNYRVLAMKDVNNYIAISTDRKVKARGLYGAPSLKKNPTAYAAANAVAEWLRVGTPFEETIKNSPFIHFISARKVTGGGQQNGNPLGKVVRWYQSIDKGNGPIVYAKNGNKVPKTDGAKACMTLHSKTVHPEDLDYEWYIKEAIKIAVDTGCSEYLEPEQLTLVAKPPKKQRKAKNVISLDDIPF